MDIHDIISYSKFIMQIFRGPLLFLTALGLGSALLIAKADDGLAGPQPFPVPIQKPVITQAALGENINMLRSENAPYPKKKPEITVADLVPQIKAADKQPQSKPFWVKSAQASTDENTILSRSDRLIYSEIFALQQQDKMDEALAKLDETENTILKGHVLANHYLHSNTVASFQDLKTWLINYADHAEAQSIYDLAVRKASSGQANTLKQPTRQSTNINGILGRVSNGGKRYKTTISRTEDQNKQVQSLQSAIKNDIKNYQPQRALQTLKSSSALGYIDSVEIDRIKSDIAAGFLYAGQPEQALVIANDVINRSGYKAPFAGWIAGLSAWQSGYYKQAASSFEVAASSPYSSGWLISASGYWASRAHMRSGNVSAVSKWLEVSSSYPRTFYGMIATRAMGQDYDFDWSMPVYDFKVQSESNHTATLRRIAALAEIGQSQIVDQAIRHVYQPNDTDLKRSLMVLAHQNAKPALQIKLGHAVPRVDEHDSNQSEDVYDAALYPLMPWQPKDGYVLDKALIHAFVRQESKFDPTVQNPSGATGLMQLMPRTASYISNNPKYETGQGKEDLKKPEVNLQIGQSYLQHLLDLPVVNQDIMSLAVAYNAGPGNLAKWKSKRSHISDPLLFIETIPYAETRAFVERVMSNYWIYRIQLDQPTPSLDAVAEGRWARYVSMDVGTAQYAKAQ